jgi:hypothetical protein
MGNHLASIHWQRNGNDFNYETYDRIYTIHLRLFRKII